MNESKRKLGDLFEPDETIDLTDCDLIDNGGILLTESGDEVYVKREGGMRIRILFPHGLARRLGLLFGNGERKGDLST